MVPEGSGSSYAAGGAQEKRSRCMDLTIDEQRLIAAFRRLAPSGRDDLLAAAAALVRRAGSEGSGEDGSASNQCKVKARETLPESEKTPIFTE